MNTEEEIQLLNAARSGDAQAFERLSQLMEPRLQALASKYTRCVSDAEDAVQEALFRAWMSLSSFREDSLFSTWVTRIMLNEIFKVQRRRDYSKLVFSESLCIAEAAALSSGRMQSPRTPEDDAIHADASTHLHKAVSRLPAPFRVVLQLELKGGRSCVEIAEHLRISVAALKTRRLRARAELMRSIGPHSSSCQSWRKL